jgi:hypothetical protein
MDARLVPHPRSGYLGVNPKLRDGIGTEDAHAASVTRPARLLHVLVLRAAAVLRSACSSSRSLFEPPFFAIT